MAVRQDNINQYFKILEVVPSFYSGLETKIQCKMGKEKKNCFYLLSSVIAEVINGKYYSWIITCFMTS